MDLQTHHKAESLVRKIRDLETEHERFTKSVSSESDTPSIKIGDRFCIRERGDPDLHKSVIQLIGKEYELRIAALNKEFEAL